MDIFIEQIVAKKRTGKTWLRIIGGIVGALLFLWLFFALIFPITVRVIPGLGAITFLLCAGVIYLLYLLVVNSNLEYEYCFTNGMMDVDKIINRKSRKRMLEVNARKIEKMASVREHEFASLMQNREIKKIYACTRMDDEGVYYLLFDGEKGRQLLLFNPNDKIKESFRRYNPQKVFLDA